MAARGSILNGKMSAAVIQYVDATGDIKLVYDTKNKLITVSTVPTEANAFNFTKVNADTVTLSEVQTLHFTKAAAEVATVSESTVFDISKLTADAVTFLEAQVFGITRGITDAVSFSEAQVFSISKSILDTQVISDVLAITIWIGLTDSTPGFIESVEIRPHFRKLGEFMFGETLIG